MPELTVAELAKDAQREFRPAFGDTFRPTSCQIFSQSDYRGGFKLVFSHSAGRCEVVYSDMELDVSLNGKELFGPKCTLGSKGTCFLANTCGSIFLASLQVPVSKLKTVMCRANKPLVPIRNGEAPLLAAQRRRGA
jgi:hypothetical protein